MAVIKSDNTKGNPYHKSADGQFTSKEGAGSDAKSKLSQIFSVKKGEKLKGLISAKDASSGEDNSDFWEKVKAEKEKIEQEKELSGASILDDSWFEKSFGEDTAITDKKPELNVDEKVKKVINGLDYKSAYDDAINDPTLDLDKIKNASEEELKELLQAKSVLKEQNKDYSLDKANKDTFYGIWQYPVKPSDYLEKKDKIEAKKAYFINDYQGADKEAKLANLDAFVNAGEKYAAAKEAFDAKYGDAQAIVDRYSNDLYSQERKNSAKWIGGKNYPVLGSGHATAESEKVFGPNANKVLGDLAQNNPKQYNAVKSYTSSYVGINSPLRGEDYYNGMYSKESFVETVEGMTAAIDKSTYDFDYWCQRGTSRILDKENGIDIRPDMSLAELKQFVGKKYVHRSFYSAGAAKGTGFTGSEIIINTYCPKGTKGLYVKSISSFEHENEIILQRGYSYKITKAYKKDGKVYIDAEVLLGSDEDKYNHDELVKLANKHIH